MKYLFHLLKAEIERKRLQRELAEMTLQRDQLAQRWIGLKTVMQETEAGIVAQRLMDERNKLSQRVSELEEENLALTAAKNQLP